MTLVIPFPDIDPVLIQIGPFAIRWYALSYIAGFLAAWRYMRALAVRSPGGVTPIQVDDFIAWAIVGAVLGARLGYVLFWKPGYYLANPGEIVLLWQGGMSFHGGLLGVVAACVWFTRRHGVGLLALADLIACAAPIGLFLGRIANFINGELWGRPSELPWAVVFPLADDLPRHPVQIYSSLLEGLALFAVMFGLWRWSAMAARRGSLTGAYLIGAGVARTVLDLYREPEAYMGTLFWGVTMGQLLSLPLIAGGLWLIVRSRPADPVLDGGGHSR
jgi:phosphatidylglycerol:prolipoprotein diacylglycerol transferase